MKPLFISLLLATALFAQGSDAYATIWESKVELPVGAACPARASQYDDVAYQVNGNGGYVCFSCEYDTKTTRLLVTRQVRCNKQIKCRRGICK